MEDQVRAVMALVDDVLGPEVVGAYLHGSAVLGGLRPASDVDVLVVAGRSLTEPERRALLDGLLRVSGFTGGLRPVELTVVVQSEVRPWRYPPTGDFLYGEWLREEFQAGGPPRPTAMADLAIVLTMVLAGDHALAGPPPARVLDPVPYEDVARAATAGIPELLAELDGDTRNVLLTLARIWSTLATGEIRPKDAAAAWALRRLPPEHRPVLEHARRLYLGSRYAEESWSEELRARVRPHAEHVVAEIGKLSRP
ncbi:aminoglycoside adenylyltransferase family protein [Streptomyces sp. WMMC500]|uniref:aminoglycoside adenylyltransferase family protein n=1 Tax=Streptomyces sp. WMMC500 TaxID=3015154 RepID=UPI00248C11B9|nr:aminoglycoside adenylyltransferase family protein [Streptomyces sp. WMMC500]WBB61080.1 aminoglycoside adenylyltransferase family protein [Streptomyces sp. WMMC500]